MPKIDIIANCGNSPKMMFLRDFNIAFANGDIAMLKDAVIEDISCEIIGRQLLSGIKSYSEYLTTMSANPVSGLKVEHIVTHGKEGMVSGEMIFDNGDRFAFCDIYVFATAKGSRIKAIKSFTIPNSKD